jgi:hypothetical protein
MDVPLILITDRAMTQAEMEEKFSLILDEDEDENSQCHLRSLCTEHGVSLATLHR